MFVFYTYFHAYIHLRFKHAIQGTHLGSLGCLSIIDENFPDLSGFPDLFICQIFFSSGYGHRHISGFLSFIPSICQIFFVRPFSSLVYDSEFVDFVSCL